MVGYTHTLDVSGYTWVYFVRYILWMYPGIYSGNTNMIIFWYLGISDDIPY